MFLDNSYFYYIVLYSSSFSVLLNFILFAILIIRSLRNIIFLSISILAIFISAWSVGIIGFYFWWGVDKIFWLYWTHITGLLVGFFYLFFCLNYTKNIFNDRKTRNLILLINLPLLILIFYNLLINKNIIFYESYLGINYVIKPGYVFYSLYIIFLFVSGYFLLFKYYLKSKDLLIKKQILFILIPSTISSSIGLITDLLLPIWNIFSFTWIGPITSSIFVIFILISILNYRFLNIRILSAEISMYLLWFIFLGRALFPDKPLIQKILDLIFLAIFIFISLLFLKGLRKEVEQKQKLEILNEKLDQLNRIKSEFLSFASHQVKAPMAVVKGYAELISENIEGVPQQAKDFSKKIKESVDNLLVLIDEFMDYRKIEEGKMEMEFEEVEIVSFVRKIAENARLLAQKKNLQLIFENSLVEGYVDIDKMRFSQVIQNLIDNAIKYTQVGFIKISIDKKQNQAVICVKDTGLGMSKELQSKLFGQFIRDPSIKKEIKGTGLGLYIAKHIVEAHKGKIWAESEGEGKGSSFYVSVPLKI